MSTVLYVNPETKDVVATGNVTAGNIVAIGNITASGNVGIGTTQPLTKLQVNGVIKSIQPYYSARLATGYAATISQIASFTSGVYTNVASWYKDNNKNGYFQPLTPGLYFVSVNMLGKNLDGHIAIKKNKVGFIEDTSSYRAAAYWSFTGSYSPAATSCIIECNGIDDIIYVQTSNVYGSDASWSSFVVYLIG